MYILGKDGRTHDLAKEAREDYNMDLDVELEQVNTRTLSIVHNWQLSPPRITTTASPWLPRA